MHVKRIVLIDFCCVNPATFMRQYSEIIQYSRHQLVLLHLGSHECQSHIQILIFDRTYQVNARRY